MNWIFPSYPLRIEQRGGRKRIWDPVRKNWYLLQPEEYVRQHLLHFLIEEKSISPALIGVEREIRYHDMRKRFDVVVFDSSGDPFLLCECKAPEVALTQATLHQIARYNAALPAPHWLITNGQSLLVFSRDAQGKYQFQPHGWIDG